MIDTTNKYFKNQLWGGVCAELDWEKKIAHACHVACLSIGAFDLTAALRRWFTVWHQVPREWFECIGSICSSYRSRGGYFDGHTVIILRSAASSRTCPMGGSLALIWSSHPVLEFPPPFGDLQAAVIYFSTAVLPCKDITPASQPGVIRYSAFVLLSIKVYRV